MDPKGQRKAQEGAQAIATTEGAPAPERRGRLDYALDGLRAAWREEAGFRNHVFGALAMLATLIIVDPAAIWWAVALFCSSVLIALELVNSAIERVIDHIDGRIHPRIKAIKDMSAAAVVAASTGVFLLGVIMIADTLT